MERVLKSQIWSLLKELIEKMEIQFLKYIKIHMHVYTNENIHNFAYIHIYIYVKHTH